MSTVLVTNSKPYPMPESPAESDRASVAYDRWDTGWWTFTSIPDGLAPVPISTLRYGLETPPMIGENHASRIRAILRPTTTDDCTFYLSGDDARLLFNHEGYNASGADVVAPVAGWTEQYQWDRYQSQRTATYRLKKNQPYYIEAIAVHGLGHDHLEVGWSRDGGPIEVVPNDVLTPTQTGAGGWRQEATEVPNCPDPTKASCNNGYYVVSVADAGST